jgi:hypothetical protein
MKATMPTSVPSQPARLALVVALGAMVVAPCGFAFQFANGDLTGNFDSTFSIGGLYRKSDPSQEYYGTTNVFNGVPGLQNSANNDDGNLNFKKGWVSELFKGSHDLELKYHDFGFFARGYYFKDTKTDETLRTPSTSVAKQRVTQGGEMLDLYVVAKFELAGNMPLDVRIGRQVLSLGESTFIPNGNNVVNPVDLSKLRAPGADLKEAFLPVNMVKLSIGLTKDVTLEPFWLLEFRHNELEPAGTYFSTNDFASPGGSKVFLGFGTLPDSGTLGGIPRGDDRKGNGRSQYGVALRVLAPHLNNTEFGFYYAKYDSRSPLISSITPTSAISSAFVQQTAASLAQTNLAPAMIANGYPPSLVPTAINALLQVAFGIQPASILTPLGATPFLPAAQSIAAGAGKIGLLTAAATGRYFNEYPEGINMFGVSFNTAVGNTGISWQGEVSVKNDIPLQVDDVELLFATLSSLNPVFGANNQIGSYLGQLGKELPGYRRHRAVTAQSTLTKVFGPAFGAQQLTVLGEVGAVFVNLPPKSVLRYDGPGTFTSGSASAMINTGFGSIPPTPEASFADSTSWGYQFLARLDYTNVFAGVNISPTIAYANDVRGTTPLPLGNFVAGRQSVNLSAEFTFQNAWAFEVRYVNYFGGGRFNLLSDRDYYATTLKYSF